MTEALERYRRFLETLTPDTLPDLPIHVTADVRFKDPFNDVRGVDSLERVFRHMFANVGDVRFHVDKAGGDSETGFLAWRFSGRLKGKPWTFEGTSVLHFAEDGRVAEHVDHWDAGRDFYERLPVLGWLLSRIRGRVAIR